VVAFGEKYREFPAVRAVLRATVLPEREDLAYHQRARVERRYPVSAEQSPAEPGDAIASGDMLMRAFRSAIAGLVGMTVALGAFSLLSGCGEHAAQPDTSQAESPEAKRETQQILDAMKNNKGLPKETPKAAPKGAPKGGPKAVRD